MQIHDRIYSFSAVFEIFGYDHLRKKPTISIYFFLDRLQWINQNLLISLNSRVSVDAN